MKTRYTDIKITEPNGEIVFEKNGVEVPEQWSDRAATIAASKYFHYDENSVLTLVGRIARQIMIWGQEQRYFEDETQAHEFMHSLEEILLNQRAAFNSPVWFNVGVAENDNQTSACFIYGVEDNMEDILEHSKREGLTFKSGSGAGVNVSNLRAQGELLSNRGVASGPLSFMRIWDQTAGSIRSGGKTRRSAKMVIMDIDHPDIEEFIDCKLLEEKKAKILMENGVPQEEAYATVAFQNANHSIMVTDEFMKAVKSDLDWPLNNRGDGQINKTVNARELFHKIAKVAWATGDPGLQFRDRINLDNPVPSLGDIECSNPCAEHLAINNSACNLASLNLIKYLTDDNQFNIKQFEEDINIIVTAQDIIINPADYPTEASKEVAVDTRPLGLGFANLGAYLMVLGYPYDSQEARDEAANITKLMTTAAYKTSAMLARRLGPYNTYRDNKKQNLDLIYRLTENDLLVAETESSGVRNSQVTCLAPTGTISFLMDCDTTGIEPLYALKAYKQLAGGGTLEMIPRCVEKALVDMEVTNSGNLDPNKTQVELTISKLSNTDQAIFKTANDIDANDHIAMMAACQKHLNGAISKCVTAGTMIPTEEGIIQIGQLYTGEEEDSFREINLRVASENHQQIAKEFYYGGKRNTVKIILKDGRTIEGTPNHKIKAVTDNGRFEWVRLDELSERQYIGIKFGDNVWSDKDACINFKQPSLYGCQKEILIPTQVIPDLGWLLGVYIAEGNMSESNWTVRITNNNNKVLHKVKRLGSTLFGLEGKITRDKRNNVGSICFHSKSLYLLFTYLGAAGSAETKKIPRSILQSSEKTIRNFITGLWLDGYVRKSNATAAICLKSKTIIRQLQILLTNFGIRSNQIQKYNKEYKSYFYELLVHGEQLRKFKFLFGPLDDDWKQNTLEKHCNNIAFKKHNRIYSDVFPCYKEKIQDFVTKQAKRSSYPSLFDNRTKNPSWQLIADIFDTHEKDILELPEVTSILDWNIHFVQVDSIENSSAEVYDFYVPENNAFIGNGIINHNTVNLPSDATIEEVENTYLNAWKEGLKSIAIYRDGSKEMQPLTTKKIEVDTVTEPNEEQWSAFRKKLPDTRQSTTHKFDVGGLKGYLTCGMYESGDLGEIFIRSQKEGTTVQGFLDGLATAVSLGLQYGVPLEIFVNKFIGSKFEPAGVTKNEDIRIAHSVTDYIFRWLGMYFLDEDDDFINETEEPGSNIVKANISFDGPPCPKCQTITGRAGSCYACPQCGETTGCS
jgi:adenosylcobalamin-dependent ribonucleoside-diphosphate reductase